MKSVITCDMEGRIETFNKGAEEMFGYPADEVIGKERVSVFSPGEIVLQNVPVWLDEASKHGKYTAKTKFVRKDGTPFNAKIRVTPTFANGKDNGQTGYCGVTEVIEEEVNPTIKFSTKLIKALAITRMPFLSAVLMPAFIGGAYAYHYELGSPGAFNWWLFTLAVIGVALLHLGSNVMNDYFDVKDGTDGANNDYFLQFSGGSRAIELGLITLEGTKRLGLALIAGATLIGLYLTAVTGWVTLLIGLAGLAIGYLYTAPPVRLVARKGLGELGIALAFGPLVTLGIVYVVTQQLSPMAFLIGLPVGLLTANILLINEFPDAESDAKTGKNHLVVTFGKEKSTYIYLSILIMAFLSNLAIVWFLPDTNPWLIGVSVASLAVGILIFRHIREHYQDRELVTSNKNTIALSALTGLLTTLALIIG
ncbi:UbiA family prenyltransferase [Phaeodactylibacter xiamenensis]|jgi:1,4-dihydroxy-2-naphthoate octaprenyltransferase|uniref:UbiA family prenyltransferase n=1 Tax=Phaeodactylibacter xiamenensis TaxID=1524460 RepID=UPI003CCBB6A5